MIMDISDCDLFVQSDIVFVGTDERGLDRHHEAYYVQIQNKDGRRWNHDIKFNSVQRIFDNGRILFVDVTESADNAVNILLEKIKIRGYIDDSSWIETDPVYGSKEWQRNWVG